MSIPSYVINFDELSALLKDYLQNGINVDVGDITFSTAEMENLLREISSKIQGVDYNSLITALNALGAKLDSLGGSLGMSGIQKIYGEMLEVISDDEPQTIEFTIPNSGRITGVTYSLSSWNYEDNWDLFINDTQLFKGVRIKEYGETKFFNVFYPVTGGQKLKFIFNNISGSNKILWVDFNILEDIN